MLVRNTMLTPKQKRFVETYLLDLNATAAAVRAGYSNKTANQQGPRLLENPQIRDAIEAAKDARLDRTNCDADWVLKRLVEEANADLADLFTDTNDLKPIEEWPEIWRTGLVTGLDIEALYEGHGKDRIEVGQTKKLRLSDRIDRQTHRRQRISGNDSARWLGRSWRSFEPGLGRQQGATPHRTEGR